MTPDTIINEQVTVWAFFDRDVFPIAMNWRRRLIKFEKVIFKSTKKAGIVKLLDIVCESGDANFELEYNSENYLWKLKRVMPKE
jgi:hypothetical protein